MTLIDTVTSKASPEYSSFLAAHSESISVGDYVFLYGKSDFAERNATYEVQTYLADWFAIGDDGCGTALLMRLDGSPEIYICGHGALGSLDPELVFPSFAQWHAAECPVPWMDDDDGYGDD